MIIILKAFLLDDQKRRAVETSWRISFFFPFLKKKETKSMHLFFGGEGGQRDSEK